ncbi:hypothetical protein HanPI659440_Chr09g0340071 [Helianthus annuus]|nr:hypothetical protein HanPI659440_Chr09g0340071 [Helianthus annuus]
MFSLQHWIVQSWLLVTFMKLQMGLGTGHQLSPQIQTVAKRNCPLKKVNQRRRTHLLKKMTRKKMMNRMSTTNETKPVLMA